MDSLEGIKESNIYVSNMTGRTKTRETFLNIPPNDDLSDWVSTLAVEISQRIHRTGEAKCLLPRQNDLIFIVTFFRSVILTVTAKCKKLGAHFYRNLFGDFLLKGKLILCVVCKANENFGLFGLCHVSNSIFIQL